MIQFCWDDDQIEHLAEHGVSIDDFEYVYSHPTKVGFSRSTGCDMRFGIAPDGRCLAICYEEVEHEGIYWVTPITGYEIDGV